eukprot:8029897-Ditylum_brightwellii.AAC.1
MCIRDRYTGPVTRSRFRAAENAQLNILALQDSLEARKWDEEVLTELLTFGRDPLKNPTLKE